MNKGLIQVYTGEGKGKTTAALGLALRAAGWDLKVAIVQFIKGNKNIGEYKAIAKIKNIDIFQFLEDKKLYIEHPDKRHEKPAQKALQKTKELLALKKYDMIILDEINNALHYELIPLSEVMDLLNTKPVEIELILTGRNAHPAIVEAAHLVTDMKQIKHPYVDGIVARKGIEY